MALTAIAWLTSFGRPPDTGTRKARNKKTSMAPRVLARTATQRRRRLIASASCAPLGAPASMAEGYLRTEELPMEGQRDTVRHLGARALLQCGRVENQQE